MKSSTKTKDNIPQFFDKRSLSRKWIKTSLIFFLLASLLGSTMRLMFVVEIPFLAYKHILHAHSHVALLGWGFMLVVTAFIYFQGHPNRIQKYNILYTLNTTAAVGMVVFFVYQGYGVFSIIFSSLHLISVYYFAFFFLKDLNQKPCYNHTKFFKWSIVWLLTSTLGILSVGIIGATLGKLHSLFYLSVQFFLHFQFNGWFTYAMLGILIGYFEQHEKPIRIPTYIFVSIQASLILTYTLSVTWSNPMRLLFYLNTLGVVLQLFAYGVLFKIIYNSWGKILFHPSSWPDKLILFGLVCFVFKILVQSLVALPFVAVISYTIRNYVIAFIHLVMLGSITFTIVGILLKKSILPCHNVSKIGWKIILTGFLITEFILFGQGTLLWMEKGFIPYYYPIILISTLLLPIGIVFVLKGGFPSPLKEENQHLL